MNNAPRRWHRWAMWPLIAVHGFGFLIAVNAYVPPAPLGSDTDLTLFSAERAVATLQTIMGNGEAHPTGSPANRGVRDAIVTELRRLGYTPELQSVFTCSAFRQYCGHVDNVLMRVRGRDSTKALLLNAHYDTQPATPGASDCMAGVASLLEVARALKRGDLPPTDVIFLFNDGEEAGLLGSTAFVERHRWAKDVSAVVNLEARGSAGPSVPVYSVGADRSLLKAYLRTARNPAPGSAYLALTRFLPLTNDIAVFDRLGVPGITFGYTRHLRHYHTALDDLDHLSLRSLQQHGEIALGITREADLATGQHSDDRAAFLAVGPWALSASSDLMWPLSWATLVGVLLLSGILIWKGPVRVPELLWGLGVWPLAVFGSFFGSAVVNYFRKLATENPNPTVSAPLWSFIGFCLVGVALALWVALPLKRWLSAPGGWLGVWTGWAALAAWISHLEPRAAYLFLAPAMIGLGCAVGSAVVAKSNRAAFKPGLVAFLVPAAFTTALWYPHLGWLVDLLGLGNLPPMAALAGIATMAGVPLVRQGMGRPLIAVLLTGLVLVGIGTRVKTFTPESPQRGNLIYHLNLGLLGEDHPVSNLVFTGFPMPSEIQDLADFSGGWRTTQAWAPQEAGTAAPVSALDLLAPELQDTQTEGARISGRLYSPRGAPVLQMVFSAACPAHEMKIGSVPVPEDDSSYALFDEDYQVFTVWTMPREGIEVTWRFRDCASRSVILSDRSYGLPALLARFAEARTPFTTPISSGDLTVVSRRVALPD